MTTTGTSTTSPSSVTVSGFACNVGKPQKVLGLAIRSGELADFKEDDGSPLTCVVGPDAHAEEAYVVVRNTGDTKRPREAVIMLGFSGPALARAVFFKQAYSPKEYNRMATWKAARYLEVLEGEPSDDFGDGEEGDDEAGED